jgi:organic hydroperoxide reductase OsmC/OhrA
MIPTVIRGWSRRSQRGTPAASDTAFASTAHLASALRRAEAAHGEHEACAYSKAIRGNVDVVINLT